MKTTLIVILLLLSSCTITRTTVTPDNDTVKQVYSRKELTRYEANTAAGITDSIAPLRIIRILNRDRYHKPRLK